MIKRKDGRWQEQVRLPGMDRPKYFYGKTQAEVKKKMAAFQQEVERGPKFSDVVDQWQSWHESQISASSVRAYDAPVRDAKEYFNGQYVSEITAEDVNSFLIGLGKKGLAKKTVTFRLNCCQMVFNYAILHGWRKDNPCAAVKIPKGLKQKKRTVPDDAILEAVERAEKVGGGLFAYILLYTGMRRGELLGLRWEDVDLEAGEIHVRRNIYYLGAAPGIKEPKTEAGTRTIGIVDKLRPVLINCRKKKGYVFGGEKPMTSPEFVMMWRTFLRENGLIDKDRNELLTPHQLRHAFATILFEADINEKDAQEIMGHSSVQVTRDIYTHIRKARKQNMMDRLNLYLNGDEEDDCQSVVNSGEIVEFVRDSKKQRP